MNILFSSCGRRVELLRFFRSALDGMGGGSIIACDIDPLAAALNEADKSFIVPACKETSFIPHIQEICMKEAIDMIIPLIDTELPVYARHKTSFKKTGTEVVVSDPDVVDICASKVKTATFFKEIGLPYLKTVFLENWEGSEPSLPAVIKPDKGSAGIGVYTVESKEDIEVLRKRIEEPVLQELSRGQEITIDCLVDRDGRLLRFVARERLEIRAGESSKGRTIKDKRLVDLLIGLFDALKAYGPITVQCFIEDGDYKFSEINPRFGGGYPLAHIAGADFPSLLLNMLKGKRPAVGIDNYRENVYMTRFDQAFYLFPNGRAGG
ncbi:MAG: ATP-grasp domain-containing protein [Thermoproteota archaeon]